MSGSLLWPLTLGGLIALTPTAQDPSDGLRKIAPLFEVPATYHGDYGGYSSMLVREDGRPVRNAVDWRERREEIRRDWMHELGPWPKEIDKPGWKLLTEEHAENITRKKIELRVAPDRTTVGYLLVPDGAGKRPAVLDVFYTPDAAAGLD